MIIFLRKIQKWNIFRRGVEVAAPYNIGTIN